MKNQKIVLLNSFFILIGMTTVVVFVVNEGNSLYDVLSWLLINPVVPESKIKLILILFFLCAFLCVICFRLVSFDPLLKADPVIFIKSVFKDSVDGMAT